jgi:hypothetical protein
VPSPASLTQSADALRPAADGADMTDAAAFELGRLLALSDAALCQALLSGRARGGWRFELVTPHLSREDLERLRDELLGRELMLDLAADLLGPALDEVLKLLPPPADPGGIPRDPPPAGGGRADPTGAIDRLGDLAGGLDLDAIATELGSDVLTLPGTFEIDRWAHDGPTGGGLVLDDDVVRTLDGTLDRERDGEGPPPGQGRPGDFP